MNPDNGYVKPITTTTDDVLGGYFIPVDIEQECTPEEIDRYLRDDQPVVRAGDKNSSLVKHLRQNPAARYKGVWGGTCNRSACSTEEGVIFFNSSTRKYYCQACAGLINGWSLKDEGEILCKPHDHEGNEVDPDNIPAHVLDTSWYAAKKEDYEPNPIERGPQFQQSLKRRRNKNKRAKAARKKNRKK